MSIGAAAVTIFHPPADSERFGRWVTGYLATARHSSGYVGTRQSVQKVSQFDSAVEVRFETVEMLDAWLDGAERQGALAEGEAQGFWRSACDLIIAHGDAPPANVAVFLHNVAPGKEADFTAAQTDLTSSAAAFPGYEGTALFPADSTGQWLSLLRFRTAQHLAGWIQSQERREVLPRLRNELTRDFAELPRSAPFGATVRVADGQTKITPGWKSAMLVLLCLYPTVMVLSKSLAPALSRLGVQQPLAVFTGNLIGVALLQWILVPAVSRPFRRWLDPVDGAAAGISAAGGAMIVVVYAVLLTIFMLVR